MTKKEQKMAAAVKEHATNLSAANSDLFKLKCDRMESARVGMVEAAIKYNLSKNAQTDFDLVKAAKRLLRTRKAFEEHSKKYPNARFYHGEEYDPYKT